MQFACEAASLPFQRPFISSTTIGSSLHEPKAHTVRAFNKSYNQDISLMQKLVNRLLFCQCDHLLELKSSPNAFKICPNCSQSSFHKFIFLQNSPKSRHSFWATIVSKFISKTFKNHPIWSHWFCPTIVIRKTLDILPLQMWQVRWNSVLPKEDLLRWRDLPKTLWERIQLHKR